MTIDTTTVLPRPVALTNGRWGEAKTEAEIERIPVPATTATYCAVPQIPLFKQWAAKLQNAGYKLSEPVHFTNGKQFISKVTIGRASLPFQAERLWQTPTYTYEAAIMNSYDMSRALSSGLGTRVFVCANGMMSAEVKLKTRHTSLVMQRLDNFLDLSVTTLEARAEATYNMFNEYEITALDKSHKAPVDHLLMESARRGIIAPSGIMEVYKHWVNPEHREFRDHNVWSLYNAFTSYQRGRNEFAATDRFNSLHSLFQSHFNLNSPTPDQVVARILSNN